jgi:hypothetical protein
MGDSAHTTHHTNPEKKSAPPLFLRDENIFQKSARVVLILFQFRIEPREPIFEKCSHLREKGGVLMLLKTTPHLGAKAQYRGLTAVSLSRCVVLLGAGFDSHAAGTVSIYTCFSHNKLVYIHTK